MPYSILIIFGINKYSRKKVEFKTGWPSGLRRWIKAPISSGAWVRIPLQSILFHQFELIYAFVPKYDSIIVNWVPVTFCIFSIFEFGTLKFQQTIELLFRVFQSIETRKCKRALIHTCL